MKKDSRIFVAGENTLEGRALLYFFQKKGYVNVSNIIKPEPNFCDHDSVRKYFEDLRPEYVFLLAGKSGGIKANQRMPATLMLDNLRIISNLLSVAHEFEVGKLLYLASSCVYPKFAKQPMRPDMIMTGHLEPTNSSYATAKLAGVQLCKAYRTEHDKNYIVVIPANIFGPGDNFSIENSHVIAALIRKMHEAKFNGEKSVKIWGTGQPKREFIYVEDLVDACIYLMRHYNDKEPINVGTGVIITIADLAKVIKKIVSYEGTIEFDISKPDGMPEKSLDSSQIFSIGWKARTAFDSSIKKTYQYFVDKEKNLIG